MSFSEKSINLSSLPIEYDAIIVGSGMSGGIAAKELTERGLNTLLLERGPHLPHSSGYITEHKPPWAFTFRGSIPPAEEEEHYAIQGRHGTFNAT
ncbi:MAG: NAD(P)-binding protein, partial [Pseudomonadota bacterium]